MAKIRYLIEVYYNCTFFVLTSHHENFGVAVLEALAFDKPVLVSDQVGLSLEIKNNNLGVVVKLDVDKILNGLRRMHQELNHNVE